jgi:hypothetical protein
VLPALPLSWRVGGAARGLRARGGLEVDVVWGSGSVASLVLAAKERAWNAVSLVLPSAHPTLQVVNVSTIASKHPHIPVPRTCALPVFKRTAADAVAVQTHAGTDAVTMTLLNLGLGCQVGIRTVH